MNYILSTTHIHKYESLLKLKDGEKILLRPIEKSDRYLLVDFFNRMSPQSVYLRFLRRLNTLPQNIINQLLIVDYHSNFALAAVAYENKEDVIIAVGRYGYDPDENSTDLAVAVRDDWHQIGLGKIMLSKVVDIAKYHGIKSFTGMMDPKNNAIKKLLQKLGYNVKYSFDSGFYKVEITI